MSQFLKLVVLLLSANAFFQSNAAYQYSYDETETIGPILVLAKKGVSLKQETLRISCHIHNRCAFEAKYQLASEREIRTTVVAKFFGNVADVTLNGRTVNHTFVSRKDTMDPDLNRKVRCSLGLRGNKDTARIKFTLDKGESTLVVSGDIPLPEINNIFYGRVGFFPGVEARHITNTRFGKLIPYLSGCYDLWPVATWNKDAKVLLELDYKQDDFRFAARHETENGFESFPVNDGTYTRELKASDAGKIIIERHPPRWLSYVPGFLVGLGQNRDRYVGRMQLGHGWVFLATSIGIEIAEKRRARQYAVVELITPNMFLFIPGLSYGINWIKDRDEIRARPTMGIQYPLLGANWTYDNEEGVTFQFTLSI